MTAVKKISSGRKKAAAKNSLLASDLPEDKKSREGRPFRGQTAFPKAKSFGVYHKIAFSFIFLTLVLLAVIFYFSFIKVKIVILPKPEEMSGELTVDVYDQDKKVEEAANILSGLVREAEVSQTKDFPASGAEILGQEVTGKVTIINNYNKNQPLVATTRLLSPEGKLYRLRSTVNVPAGGSAEAEVYADQAKEEMAIGPATFTIPGLWSGLQDKIYAQSQEAFSYQEKIRRKISQEDIDQAVASLRDSLLSQAQAEIARQYPGYDLMAYEINLNSLEQKVDGKVGEEKDSFSVTMKTKVAAALFNISQDGKEKLSDLARENLSSLLPANKEIASVKDFTCVLESYDLTAGRGTVKVNFQGTAALKSGAAVIDKNKLLGLTRAEAENYLKNIPEISGFKITFSPNWVKRVPSLADRVEVEVKN